MTLSTRVLLLVGLFAAPLIAQEPKSAEQPKPAEQAKPTAQPKPAEQQKPAEQPKPAEPKPTEQQKTPRVVTVGEVTIVGRVQKPVAAVDVSRIPPKLQLGELHQPFWDRIERALYDDPF